MTKEIIVERLLREGKIEVHRANTLLNNGSLKAKGVQELYKDKLINCEEVIILLNENPTPMYYKAPYTSPPNMNPPYDTSTGYPSYPPHYSSPWWGIYPPYDIPCGSGSPLTNPDLFTTTNDTSDISENTLAGLFKDKNKKQ